jgi:hypothetical protein
VRSAQERLHVDPLDGQRVLLIVEARQRSDDLEQRRQPDRDCS